MIDNSKPIPKIFQDAREFSWEKLREKRVEITRLLLRGEATIQLGRQMASYILAEMSLEDMMALPEWEEQAEEIIKAGEEAVAEMARMEAELVEQTQVTEILSRPGGSC